MGHVISKALPCPRLFHNAVVLPSRRRIQKAGRVAAIEYRASRREQPPLPRMTISRSAYRLLKSPCHVLDVGRFVMEAGSSRQQSALPGEMA